MGCNCSGKKDEGKKGEQYKCEPCGNTSNKPGNCCGKPMKKVSK